MKRLIILIVIIGLSGCASMPGMPGHITFTQVKTDSTKQLSMIPAWVSGANFRIGLFKTTSMDKNSIFIVVTARDIIRSDKGLIINVDGKITTLSSIDQLADIDTSTHMFSKMFKTDLDLIRSMTAGKKVYVKMINNEHQFTEGDFTKTPKDDFIKFLKELPKLKAEANH